MYFTVVYMNFKDKLDFGDKQAVGCRRSSENMVSDDFFISNLIVASCYIFLINQYKILVIKTYFI